MNNKAQHTLDTYCTSELADALMDRCAHTNGMQFVSEELRDRLADAITNPCTKPRVFNAYMLVLLVAFTLVVGVFSYALCFEAGVFGGWLPFLTLLAGPVMGWLAAKASQ